MHKNSPKRFYGPDKIYFIVTKTHQNFPYFKESIFCDLLIEELKLCKKLKRFKLYGFSIIYDHLNLFLKPGRKYNISKVMKSLKENVSRDINYIIFGKRCAGDTATCRLSIRRVIDDLRDQYIEKCLEGDMVIPVGDTSSYRPYTSSYRPIRFKWQKSFYDHVVRNEKDFHNHYNYTKYNHMKHGLPEDWPYTSEHYEDLIDETTFP